MSQILAKRQRSSLIILYYRMQGCRICAKTNWQQQQQHNQGTWNGFRLAVCWMPVYCALGALGKKMFRCPSGILVIIHLGKFTARCGVPQESASHFHQCQIEAWPVWKDISLKRSMCDFILIQVNGKWKFCHHLLTLMLFQTYDWFSSVKHISSISLIVLFHSVRLNGDWAFQVS